MDHGTFLGWIGDDVLHSLYRIADVCVVPSIYEPFGLVALEAMASDCPCIVADTGGLREVVPHNEAGLRFRARDPEALGEMVERLLTDPALRDRLVAEGSEHVLRFDWADVAESTAGGLRRARRRARAAPRSRTPGRRRSRPPAADLVDPLDALAGVERPRLDQVLAARRRSAATGPKHRPARPLRRRRARMLERRPAGRESAGAARPVERAQPARAARVAAAASAPSPGSRTTRCGAGQPAPKSSVRSVSRPSIEARLVGGVSAALLAEQEAGAADDRLGARVEVGPDVGGGGDRRRPRGPDSRRERRPGPARAAPGPESCRGRGRPPRRPARSPRRRRPPRAATASSTDPPWWIQGFAVRRRGVPQKVTTTSASEAASKWARAGERQQQVHRQRPVGQPRVPRRSRPGAHRAPRKPIVPSPPASETAAASSWPARPPPIPAWTTGRSTADRSSSVPWPHSPRIAARPGRASAASAAPRASGSPSPARRRRPRSRARPW